MITVLMIVHNQKELLAKSIESLRLSCINEDDVQVVVVDNASEDGTGEWLAGQGDIAYATEEVYCDNWGRLANEAIEIFSIEGDILIMEAGVLLTAGCVDCMRDGMHAQDDIAAVGPMMNGTSCQAEISMEHGNRETVLDLDKAVVMICGEIFERCMSRRFEEAYSSRQFTLKDYMITVMKQGYLLSRIRNAIAIDMCGEQKLRVDAEREVLKGRHGMKYFNSTGNVLLLKMIDRKAEEKFSVLEIGCDCGANLLEIKKQFPNAETYGYEINPNAADIAEHFAQVAVGNVEEEALPYRQGQFDYILFGDVLEHLHDPERVIIYCRRFLKESGCIVASIPNLMHISVIGELLEGRFSYADTGLLDRTHIHFFTFHEILWMLGRAGYQMERIEASSVVVSAEEEEMKKKIMSIVQESKEWMFDAFQYVFRSRKI